MKIAATIARYLLGIIFVFFGSNILFHFLPNPPMIRLQLETSGSYPTNISQQVAGKITPARPRDHTCPRSTSGLRRPSP